VQKNPWDLTVNLMLERARGKMANGTPEKQQTLPETGGSKPRDYSSSQIKTGIFVAIFVFLLSNMGQWVYGYFQRRQVAELTASTAEKLTQKVELIETSLQRYDQACIKYEGMSKKVDEHEMFVKETRDRLTRIETNINWLCQTLGKK
jgi:hypothetical protein